MPQEKWTIDEEKIVCLHFEKKPSEIAKLPGLERRTENMIRKKMYRIKNLNFKICSRGDTQSGSPGSK